MWEYMWRFFTVIEHDSLNEFGKDRWELVSVVYAPDHDSPYKWAAFFKRRLRGER